MQKRKIIKLCKPNGVKGGAKLMCKTKWISGITLKNKGETGVKNPVENVHNI